MGAVKLESVMKRYGAVEVITGISLDIEEGEFVVLLGPSGCGKSTLLRMVAGLEEISGGTISIGGNMVNDVPARERSVAMVFQNYALYPHMTVAENMGFALKMRGIDKAEINRKVGEAAEILGLSDYLDRRPKALSGGQRQRVAMGRAIVRNPNVFLFDEPLSNLDAKLRAKMRVEIEQLHRRLGATSLFVTHDQVEAMTMADKIVLLNGGVIQQAGTPEDLYDRPANLFVAEFIGAPAMNLVRGEIEGQGAEKHLRLGNGETIPLGDVGIVSSGPVVCGFRPEKLALEPDPQGSETIVAVENLGHQTIVHCRGPIAELSALVDRSENNALREGQQVRITPQTGTAHLFDPQSGKRLN